MRLKKMISIIISSVMAVSMLPLTAFATEKAPEPSSVNENTFSDYLQINYTYSDTDYLEAVDKIVVNDNEYKKVSYSWDMDETTFISSSISYYIGLGMGKIEENESNEIVISANGYEDITLTVEKSGGGGTYQFQNLLKMWM